MIKELLGNKLKIMNAMKICIFIIATLLLIGVIIGVTQGYKAKLERTQIQKINNALQYFGINEQLKNSVDLFLKKYPDTQNVVITDNQSKIVYSSNKKVIGDISSFKLERYSKYNGLSKLQGTNIYFITNQQSFKMRVPFNDKNLFLRQKPNDKNDQFNFQGMRRNAFKGIGPENNDLLKNAIFVKSFNAQDKGLQIFYISSEFKENNFNKIMFISSLLLRIALLLLWVLLAAWVYRDSKQRGLLAVLWGIFIIITGIFGFIVYLIYRQFYTYCPSCERKVDKNDNYCGECGYTIKTKCFDCQKALTTNINYCPNCGKNQDETK